MTSCRPLVRPLLRCLRQSGLPPTTHSVPIGARHASLTSKLKTMTLEEFEAARQLKRAERAAKFEARSEAFKQSKLDPNTTTLRWAERRLMKKGIMPVGSRRRRVAIRTSQNMPFELLPYQCFQEARKVLLQDRKEKLRLIVAELERIRRLEATDGSTYPGGEDRKQRKLTSMRNYVEELKIMTDINDPLVKRKFEDGMGDMNKPIYRYLADRRWRAYDRKLIVQRVQQFHIVPDVLPHFEPAADVKMFFRSHRVAPGEILPNLVTEVSPRLRVQVFDRGDRLLTLVVLDPDVPVPETDGFARRLHFLAANIPWSPTMSSLPLGKVDASAQLAVPWLPPTAQKGAPYHRLAVFVLEQKGGAALDLEELKRLYAARDGFSLKSFRDKFPVAAVGFNMFRSVWDEGTETVMRRHGITGADVEFKRVRHESLQTPKKQRGWEAKRQKPKYRSLWKYTKRIRGAKWSF